MPLTPGRIDELRARWTNWLTDDHTQAGLGPNGSIERETEQEGSKGGSGTVPAAIPTIPTIPTAAPPVTASSAVQDAEQVDDFSRRMELFMAKKRDEMETKLKAYSVEQPIQSPIQKNISSSPNISQDSQNNVKSPSGQRLDLSIREEDKSSNIVDSSASNSMVNTRLRMSALNTRTNRNIQQPTDSEQNTGDMMKHVPYKEYENAQDTSSMLEDHRDFLKNLKAIGEGTDNLAMGFGAQRLVLSSHVPQNRQYKVGDEYIPNTNAEKYNELNKPERDRSLEIVNRDVKSENLNVSNNQTDKSPNKENAVYKTEEKSDSKDDEESQYTLDFLSRARKEILDSSKLQSLYKRYAIYDDKDVNTNNKVSQNQEVNKEEEILKNNTDNEVKNRSIITIDNNDNNDGSSVVKKQEKTVRFAIDEENNDDVSKKPQSISKETDEKKYSNSSSNLIQPQTVNYNSLERKSDVDNTNNNNTIDIKNAVEKSVKDLKSRAKKEFSILNKKIDDLMTAVEISREENKEYNKKKGENWYNPGKNNDFVQDEHQFSLFTLQNPVETLLGIEPLLGVKPINKSIVDNLCITFCDEQNLCSEHVVLRFIADVILSSLSTKSPKHVRPVHKLVYYLLGKYAKDISLFKDRKKRYEDTKTTKVLEGSGGALSPEELTSSPVNANNKTVHQGPKPVLQKHSQK